MLLAQIPKQWAEMRVGLPRILGVPFSSSLWAIANMRSMSSGEWEMGTDSQAEDYRT